MIFYIYFLVIVIVIHLSLSIGFKLPITLFLIPCASTFQTLTKNLSTSCIVPQLQLLFLIEFAKDVRWPEWYPANIETILAVAEYPAKPTALKPSDINLATTETLPDILAEPI